MPSTPYTFVHMHVLYNYSTRCKCNILCFYSLNEGDLLHAHTHIHMRTYTHTHAHTHKHTSHTHTHTHTYMTHAHTHTHKRHTVHSASLLISLPCVWSFSQVSLSASCTSSSTTLGYCTPMCKTTRNHYYYYNHTPLLYTQCTYYTVL